MKSTLIRVSIFACCAILTSPTWAQRRGKATGLDNGEMLAQSCSVCHGYQGASSSPDFPIIGGQQMAYLNLNLKNFRDDVRPSTVMGRLMKGYSDNELAAISKYFASQPFVRKASPSEPAKIAEGSKLHEQHCNRCHTNGGKEGEEADYPVLAGQHLAYLDAMMTDIKQGKRQVDEKMDAKIAKLTQDQLHAIMHFYASQR